MSEKAPEVREALAVYTTESPETERVPPGYRQTEVGVIPEDWEQTIIGEQTVKVGSGITPTGGSRVYKQTGRAFLRSQNVGWGQLLMDEIAYIDERTHESFKETEVKSGDVLLNITGASIGRSAIADHRVEGGNVNQHVCIIRPKKGQLDPRFLNSFLLSNSGQRQIDSFQAGGNREGLNFMQIRSFLLPLPPLLEQRAIAAALSDVDALISSLDRLISKKRAVKTAAMQQLLTGKQRLPEFSGEWETRRLGEIARITMGRTPSRPVQAYWGRGYPWLSIADLKTKCLTTTKEEITEAAVADMSVIPKGTLVMSFKLTIGKLAFTGRDMYSNEAICGFNDLDADAEFLYYILGRTDFSLYGKQAVKGYTLNTESLNVVEIPYPPLEEQTAIAAVLSDMDAEISALEARREKTRRIKHGMMQELLTGRTRLGNEGESE